MKLILLQYENFSTFFNSVIHFIAFYRFHFIWDGFKILFSIFFNQFNILLQGNDPLHEAGWLRDEPLLPASVKQTLRYLHRGSTRSLSRKSWSLFTGDMSMGNWESEGEHRQKERKTTVDIWSSPLSSRFKKMHKTDRKHRNMWKPRRRARPPCDANQKRQNIPKHQRSGLGRHYVLLWVWAPLLHNTRLRPDRLNLTFHRIYGELLTSFFFFFTWKAEAAAADAWALTRLYPSITAEDRHYVGFETRY